jgi:hypothetical protein
MQSSQLLTRSSHLGPHILLSILFANTLNLCSSLNVGDQVSHPYKTVGKIKMLYILILFFRQRTGRQKILNWMIPGIPRIHSALNFFVNAIFVWCCRSQIFELYHIFEGFICYHGVTVLSCILVTRHKHIIGFRCVLFLHQSVTLQKSNKSFYVLPDGIYVFTQYINIVSIDHETMCSIQL